MHAQFHLLFHIIPPGSSAFFVLCLPKIPRTSDPGIGSCTTLESYSGKVLSTLLCTWLKNDSHRWAPKRAHSWESEFVASFLLLCLLLRKWQVAHFKFYQALVCCWKPVVCLRFGRQVIQNVITPATSPVKHGHYYLRTSMKSSSIAFAFLCEFIKDSAYCNSSMDSLWTECFEQNTTTHIDINMENVDIDWWADHMRLHFMWLSI